MVAGPRGFEPQSPAPQASVLIRARLRAHSTRLLPSRNINPEVKGKIINTLIKLKNSGLEEQTVKTIGYYLDNLASNVDLNKSDDVKAFIANKQVSNGFRGNLVKAYNYYCSINGIVWDRPHYNWEQNKPKIPTQETLNKMISSCGYKYIVIFTLLKETGAMPVELSRTTLRDIDFERNTLAIRGSKGHASRIHKLRSEVIAMLKTYLTRIGMEEYPFPSPKQMTKAWIKYKKRLSQRLCDPMLLQIRLYDLRHFYATMTYHKTKDILYTKQQMGHKKIETTLLYTQLVNFENDEFHSAVAHNIEEARKLIESGFVYVTELDGI